MLKRSDETILRIFNNRIKCSILDSSMPLITYLGSCYFAIGYSLLLLLFKRYVPRNYAFRIALGLILSTAFTTIIKRMVKRVRPFLNLKNLNIKLIDIDKYSFPSGHTTSAFTLAVITAFTFTGLSYIVITLATLVGISRMYLGVHYPTDILAGSFIGSLSAIIVKVLVAG